MMNDLYYTEYRERYYKQAHHIKQLLRKLQITDNIYELINLHSDIDKAVGELAEIKYEDLTKYKSHMAQMLTDICERGL